MTALARVVVGVDGSESSADALELALREAHLRETHVLAVTCWPLAVHHDGSLTTLCATRGQAIELLEDVIVTVRLRHRHPALVLRQVDDDEPGRALVKASRGAELVVLGASRRDGPTVRHCLVHAEAPVVVVPRAAGTDRAPEVPDVRGRVRPPGLGTPPWSRGERRSKEQP
ncbi:universal stress protein [Aeromicrobium sp. Root472D3]|uniref:universal stress protein n=1 Tax=Aeromicrobium sp. Root472D3 TaxID=1736540 RepID=UPI0006F226BC|nr:universal stress protein [Aeromicrobium sp. Root472D3]KQX75848.1 hypothetical protein ASD10_12080 [Aeromicrobium sp. Root472D3]